MPSTALGNVVLGMHGGDRHGGQGLPVKTEAVESIANAESIVEVQGHQRGRDMPSETVGHDPDLLDIGLDIVGGHETTIGFVEQGRIEFDEEVQRAAIGDQQYELAQTGRRPDGIDPLSAAALTIPMVPEP